MPDWLTITLAVASPVLSIIAALATVSFTVGRKVGVILTVQDEHSRAIQERATVEQGRGLQAQIKRVDGEIKRVEGVVSSMRTEIHDRIERHSERVDKVDSSTATMMAKLQAGFDALKESVERLISAEQEQRRPQNDLMHMIEIAKALAGKS